MSRLERFTRSLVILETLQRTVINEFQSFYNTDGVFILEKQCESDYRHEINLLERGIHKVRAIISDLTPQSELSRQEEMWLA
jgi:hypothetical protein